MTAQEAEDDARDRQGVLATELSVLVEGTAESTVSVIAGGGGIVSTQGRVELESFQAYAREVVNLSPIESLGYVPVVRGEDRESFEADQGFPIVDRAAAGFEPASPRPLYFPVQAVYPVNATTRMILGFDILADRVRGAAALDARDSGRTVLTEPVRATSNDAVSYFVVKPLYRAGAPADTTADRRLAHVGFVTTLFVGANLTEAALATLPDSSRFTLRDGDTILAASDDLPSGGTTRMLDVTAASGSSSSKTGARPTTPSPGRSPRCPWCSLPASCCSSAAPKPTTRRRGAPRG